LHAGPTFVAVTETNVSRAAHRAGSRPSSRRRPGARSLSVITEPRAARQPRTHWTPAAPRSTRSRGARPPLRPRPPRLRSLVELHGHQLVRPARPLAQDRAGRARVDDLLDRELLRGAERVAQGCQRALELGAGRVRVVGRLEVALERRLDPARERQRAPVAGGPREAEVQPRAVAVAGSRDPEDLAHQDRAPGHG